MFYLFQWRAEALLPSRSLHLPHLSNKIISIFLLYTLNTRSDGVISFAFKQRNSWGKDSLLHLFLFPLLFLFPSSHPPPVIMHCTFIVLREPFPKGGSPGSRLSFPSAHAFISSLFVKGNLARSSIWDREFFQHLKKLTLLLSLLCVSRWKMEIAVCL